VTTRCDRTRDLQAHHVVHWIRGGRTDMANLMMLCQTHHHAHHDGDFSITVIAAAARSQSRAKAGVRPGFAFSRPDGTLIPALIDPSEHPDSATTIEDENGHVTPDAAASGWSGDRLNRGYAIGILAERREQERLRQSAARSDAASGPATAPPAA
jgi:hypothetical protein